MVELAELEDETVIPRLMNNLDEEDVVYRRASVKTLGAIGANAVPALASLLGDSDNVTVKASCAKAMAQVAVNYREVPFLPEGLASLKASLNDPNPVVHIASAMALGEIGADAFDILAEALQTTDNVALAVAVVNALASVGGDRAIAVLTALANSEDEDTEDSYVREMATSALSRIELVSKYRRPDAS